MTRLRNFVSFFNRDVIIFLLCSLILYGVSYGKIWENYQRTPFDRYYWGSTEYPIDLLGDLAHVQSGYFGNWKFAVKISSTVHEEETWLKMEYLLLGHIARIFHADRFLIFSIAHVFFSLFYLSSVYFIIRRIFHTKTERNVAIILCLFSTGVLLNGQYNSFLMGSPENISVFARMTIAPHHYMLGGACLLLSLYFLSIVLDYPSHKRSFLLAIVSGFISSWVYSPGTILVFFTFPVFFIIKSILDSIHSKRITVTNTMGILFTYCLLTGIPILYEFYLSFFVKSSSNSGSLEKLNPFGGDLKSYFISLGIAYILAVISIPFILKNRKKQTFFLLLLPWIFVHPLGEFILSSKIGINQIRFFLTPFFIIFGLLATVTISSIGSFLGNFFRPLKGLLIICLVILTIGSSYLTYTFDIEKLSVCFCTYPDFGYPKKDLMIAVFWLRDHSTENDIVLSDSAHGNIISAFSGNKVYVSWWYQLISAAINDPGYWTVVYPLQGFYQGELSAKSAADFLHTLRIKYVLYGDAERALNKGGSDLAYPVLQEVIRSGSTVLYKVK